MNANTRVNEKIPMVRVRTAEEPEPIIDAVSGTVTYYGYAPLGVGTSEANWKIARRTVSGSVTITEYAGGSMEYNQIWDNRLTLQYSR